MRAIILVVIATLCGCSATALTYQPKAISNTEVPAVIEQVFLEQPPRFRPEYVRFEETYLLLGYGVVSHSQGRAGAMPLGNGAIANASSETRTQESGKRIYYSTIAGVQMYRKRDWYVLDIISTDGFLLARAYSRSKERSERFADAIGSLRSP